MPPWSGSGRYVITEVLVNAAQEKKEKTSIICGRRYRLPGAREITHDTFTRTNEKTECTSGNPELFRAPTASSQAVNKGKQHTPFW